MSYKFAALQSPMPSMLAMVAIWLYLVLMVSNSSLQGFTGTTIRLVTLYHVGVINIPVMSSNQPYFIFFSKQTNKCIRGKLSFGVWIVRVIGVTVIQFNKILPTDRKRGRYTYNRLESHIIHMKFLVREFIEAVPVCFQHIGGVWGYCPLQMLWFCR